MNNRLSTLNAQHNLPSGAGTDFRQQQPQQQQQSPAAPTQRNGFQQGQGQGRAETVPWRSTTGQHGVLSGSAQPLAGSDRSNGAVSADEYTIMLNINVNTGIGEVRKCQGMSFKIKLI